MEWGPPAPGQEPEREPQASALAQERDASGERTGTGAGAGTADRSGSRSGRRSGSRGCRLRCGATTLWPGSGRTPAVGRMAIASETTSAATPTTKIAANALPISLNDLRSGSTTPVAPVREAV